MHTNQIPKLQPVDCSSSSSKTILGRVGGGPKFQKGMAGKGCLMPGLPARFIVSVWAVNCDDHQQPSSSAAPSSSCSSNAWLAWPQPVGS